MRNSNLTFVVQGPVYSEGDGTAEVLASIRSWYPGAYLVLSTFASTPVELFAHLDADEVVLSEDPGDMTPKGFKALNINRQIVTTRAGLARVATPYVVKTRTDLVVTGRQLLDSYAPHVERGPVLVTNITTRDPDLAVRIPYWISDFLYMGRTEDLRFVFNAPLYGPSDFTHASAPSDRSHYCPDVVSIFPPEVYLGLRLLRRFRPEIRQPADLREAEQMSRKDFWDFLVDHLLVVGPEGAGLRSIKYPLPFPNHAVMVKPGKWQTMHALRGSSIEGPGRALLQGATRFAYLIRRAAEKLSDTVRGIRRT
ncbi:MAG: WavE lipopolysaccharide synthesis family protein [Pseudomonadota bacterium]